MAKLTLWCFIFSVVDLVVLTGLTAVLLEREDRDEVNIEVVAGVSLIPFLTVIVDLSSVLGSVSGLSVDSASATSASDTIVFCLLVEGSIIDYSVNWASVVG